MFGSIWKRMDRRTTMGLFSKVNWVEKPVRTVSQKKTFEEIVDNAIDNQMRIADGEQLKNGKKNKNGTEGVIPSWYNDDEKAFYPKIVIYPLFGGKGIKMDHSDYKKFLRELKKTWKEDPDFQAELETVKKKMNDANEKRLQSLRNN